MGKDGVDRSPMAKRQKRLEQAWAFELPERGYIMMRLDGNNFSKYTKGMRRPYDERMSRAMQTTMRELCEWADGCRIGYTQSDEITLLMTYFTKEETQTWRDGDGQKFASLAASKAAAVFARAIAEEFGEDAPKGDAIFDARVWGVTDPADVAENFRWRQLDCERNSVSMLAQANFSHRTLQGVSKRGMLDMLVTEKDINWNDEPAFFKRGSVSVRRQTLKPVEYTRKDTGERIVGEPVLRSEWTTEDAPIFTRSEMLLEVIPQLPPLTMERILQRAR